MARVLGFTLVVMMVLAAMSAPAAQETTQKNVSLDLSDVSARSALEALCKSAGVGYSIDPDVTGSIAAIHCDGVSFETALKQITRSAGLVYRCVDGMYCISVKKEPQVIAPKTDPGPAPVPADDQGDTMIEKVPLSYSSPHEVLQAFEQGRQYGPVTAWPGQDSSVLLGRGTWGVSGQNPRTVQSFPQGYPTGASQPRVYPQTRGRQQPLMGPLGTW